MLAPQRTWRAWATGFGGADHISGDARAGAAGQTSTIYGGVLGVDYEIAPGNLAGIALGGSEGDFQVNARTTSGTTTGGHIAVYDLATFGALYGASSTSFSSFGNTTTRTIAGFGGSLAAGSAAPSTRHEVRSRLEVGGHIDAYGATLTPFLALEIAGLRSNGFTETSCRAPTRSPSMCRVEARPPCRASTACAIKASLR